MPVESDSPAGDAALAGKLPEDKSNWSGRKDSNLRPHGPEPGNSGFACFCISLLILYTVQFYSFDQSLPGLPLCTGLLGVTASCCTKRARKGQSRSTLQKSLDI